MKDFKLIIKSRN